jgi:acyl-CoA thioesterase FadM
MSWEIQLQTDFSDLDSHGNVPLSALFIWAQKCRMQVYNKGALGELRRSTGVLMVKAQTFQFDRDKEPVVPFTDIIVTQKVASVGKTSMTFALEFKVKETGNLFARGIVVMVCVSEGKAQEIPPGVRASILLELSENGTKIKESLEEEIRQVRSTMDSSSVEANQDLKKQQQMIDRGNRQLTMDVLLRLSDEDANHHVRHVRYAQFFEDAIAVNERRIIQLRSMFVEYMKETRGGERCIVEMIENTSTGCARFEMKRDQTGEVVCRGLARY